MRQFKDLSHKKEDLRFGQIFENRCYRFYCATDDTKVMGALFAASLLDILDLICITVCLPLGLIPFALRVRFLRAKLV